ncbi:DUF429 domain-containing protein [Paeniglutamicibacter sp. NPDC091659]|uniref:DUF429 domain-containing protein n=1 Tax=Paeniglutamicibacter sp. NPDC091659 TaxID=3364389 RepID=UPI0037F3062B
MRTLGVDLAADPKKTAVAVIRWTGENAALTHLSLAVTDDEIVDLFGTTDVTGIDCPLGWPEALLPFLMGHQRNDPQAVLEQDGLAGRRNLAYRATDRFVTATTGIRPLSVSADRLGYTAMRCAAIQAKIGQVHGIQSRDGAGKLAEVYPAASLKLWGFRATKYKGTGSAETLARRELVEQLKAEAPWLQLGAHEEKMVSSDDLLDAVIASLTARAVSVASTYGVDPALANSARSEGWIHLPSGQLGDVFTAFQAPTAVVGLPATKTEGSVEARE